RPHPPRPAGVADAHRQRGVERAADLVGTGRLDRFQLEVNTAIRGGQPLGTPERRAQHATADSLGSAPDVVEADAHQPRRMSARFPANCERGSTWSAPAFRAASISSTCTCDANPIVRTPASAGSAFSAAIVAIGSAFALLRSMMTRVG